MLLRQGLQKFRKAIYSCRVLHGQAPDHRKKGQLIPNCAAKERKLSLKTSELFHDKNLGHLFLDLVSLILILNPLKKLSLHTAILLADSKFKIKLLVFWN